MISAFIVFHLTLILIVLFPSRATSSLLAAFKNYIFFFALEQNYSVFAPKPRDANVHLVAVIMHKDGTLELWEYPRMERMNQVERLFKERYRKFAHDNVVWDEFTMYLPDFARYIARLNNKTPNNPPVSISLLRYSASIPEPAQGLSGPLPPQSETQTIITYQVKPADLK